MIQLDYLNMFFGGSIVFCLILIYRFILPIVIYELLKIFKKDFSYLFEDLFNAKTKYYEDYALKTFIHFEIENHLKRRKK